MNKDNFDQPNSGAAYNGPNRRSFGIVPPYLELLTRKQAAEYLGVAEQTLAIWKSTGRYSLPFVKIGRLVKYRKLDLDAFIKNNLNGAA